MKLFNKIAVAALGASMAMGVGIGILAHNRQYMGANATPSPIMTFDFEDSTAHRTEGNNSYDSNSYVENGVTIELTKADSVTSGTPLFGSANVVARIAKNTTNTAIIQIGPMDLSTYVVTGISYYIKGVSTTTFLGQYSTNGTSWTNLEDAANCPTSSTQKSYSTLSIENPETLYFKLTVQASSSKTSNRDLQFDNLVISGESTSTNHLTGISCSAQEINVLESVNLASAITFTPNDAMNKNVSFAIKSGSDFIDMTEAGVVTGKKGGSAVVTITPEDTAGGAVAIDVNVTVSSIAAPGIAVGEQYTLYCIDTDDSYNGVLTGVADGLGTVTSFTGSVPPSDYILTVEEGYYENTVALKNGTKYLALNSAANALHTADAVSANSSWTVAWDSESEAATITNAAFPRMIMFNYNGGSNMRFACYTGGQKAISLHKYVEKALEDFTIESEINVYKTSSKAIEVTYDPADATDRALLWESDNEDIATVDEHGVVTGVAVGTTTITASKTIAGNPVERTCIVHVLNNQAAHDGSEADPFNVADAVNVANGVFTLNKSGAAINLENEYYVTGILTKNVNRTVSKLTFWLGDTEGQDTAEEGAFEIYQAGKVYGVALGTRYSDNSEVVADFAVGDIIVAKGTFTVYNGTAETSNGSADIVRSSRIENVAAINTFITNNMHMEEDVEGQCNTLFSGAMVAFNLLTDEQREMFCTDKTRANIKSAYERLRDWATAKGHHFDASYTIVEDANSSSILMNNDANPFLITMLIISSVALAGFTALIIVKKKKHQ